MACRVLRNRVQLGRGLGIPKSIVREPGRQRHLRVRCTISVAHPRALLAFATLGEIADRLRAVFGTHRETFAF